MPFAVACLWLKCNFLFLLRLTFTFHVNGFNFPLTVSIIRCAARCHKTTGFKWINGLCIINCLLAFQFTTHGSCLVMKTSSLGQESLLGWGLRVRQSKTCLKAPELKCISLKSQARLGHFIQAFRSLSAYYQIWRGSEVCTADSCSEWCCLRTTQEGWLWWPQCIENTHTHKAVVTAPLRNMEKGQFTKDGGPTPQSKTSHWVHGVKWPFIEKLEILILSLKWRVSVTTIQWLWQHVKVNGPLTVVVAAHQNTA